MGKRRMLSTDVTETDMFLDMPLSAQALYFHMVLAGDDDGFVGNPKRIQRMVGCNEDDLKLLLAKGFVIPFDSGVCVIRHWKVHNYIRSDRYKKTAYTAEMSTLGIAENGEYILLDTIGIPDCAQLVYQAAYQRETQVKLSKDIINICAPDGAQESEKSKKLVKCDEEKTASQQDKEDFEVIYKAYPKKRGKAKAFEYYLGFVGKGRVLNGIRYKLDRKQIYLAVAAYVETKEEAGTDLQFYQDFSTFMNKTILDYLPEEGEQT